MIERRRLSHTDKHGNHYDVLQTWALIPGTGVWVIFAVQPVIDQGNQPSDQQSIPTSSSPWPK